MAVASQTTTSNPIFAFLTNKTPHNDGIVARSRENQVRFFGGGGKSGYPSAMTFKLASE